MRPALTRTAAVLLLVPALSLIAGTTAATAATAQEDDEVGQVEVSFDLGSFNGQLRDWPVTVVEVRGELTDGEEFTVELRDESSVIWSATGEFEAPVTRFEVDEFVAAGRIVSADVSQSRPLAAEVKGEELIRPAEVLGGSGGGGTGELALSMVLALVIVLVVFRSPLPSASTQRWRK